MFFRIDDLHALRESCQDDSGEGNDSFAYICISQVSARLPKPLQRVLETKNLGFLWAGRIAFAIKLSPLLQHLSAMASPYRIESLGPDVFWPLLRKHHASTFQSNMRVPIAKLLSEEELAAGKRLLRNMGKPFSVHLALFADGDLVGWSFGRQTDFETYYMTSSGILPEHRRKGLYTELLKETIRLVKAEGFQIIHSRHTATNNAVIIPKLKAGFIISSMEISDPFGTLIHLRYYCNSKRRAVMDFRSGEAFPCDEVKGHLGFVHPSGDMEEPRND
jgi:ribosomal protein S18 acetylase RimI-like enzyme